MHAGRCYTVSKPAQMARCAWALAMLWLSACTGNTVLGGPADGNSPFATYPLGTGPTVSDAGLQTAMYWGQNEGPGLEPDLATLCTQPQFNHYNIIIIAFVTKFTGTRNAAGYPEMDLSNHCNTSYDPNNPYLLKCDDIAAAIPECQAAGKKVVLSLGGAEGAYGFQSDADAQAFAQTTWDMFLGGDGQVRPFGAAVLDGVDLDIESGATTGYSAYVQQLRTLMNAANDKPYLITAAPQCPYPDAFLGPGTGLAFSDALTAFDKIWVQYYNNYCEYQNPQGFADTFAKWTALKDQGGPSIFIGLPAQPAAADAAGFVDVGGVKPLVDSAKKNASFGGIMLWDNSFDMQSAQSGQPLYSYSVDRALQD